MKLVSIAVPLLLLAAWQAISALHLVNPIFLPSPEQVALTGFRQLFASGELWRDIFATLLRTAAGFAIAVVIGVSLGLVIGYSAPLHDAFDLVIDFFRSIPATALFPLFLLFLGVGDEAKVAVAVWACSFMIIVNTVYGVRNASKLRLMAARTMDAKGLFLFRSVIFPEALPHVFAGLRIALSFSLAVVIVTEMFIGTTVGLGHVIIDAQLVYNVDEMYLAVICAGAMGYALNRAFVAIERRVVHWAGR